MEHLNIVVCDDDPVFLQIMVEQLSKLETMHQVILRILPFHDLQIPDENLQECDIAFLDIDFPKEDYNGMDIARKLRAQNKKAVLIFVTNFVEYAREGYEVQAFRYLLKKELPEKLEACFALSLEQLRNAQKTYPVQVSGETIHLRIDQILYLEAWQHTVAAYLSEKQQLRQVRFYAALSNVEKDLEADGFLRTQKSYLVNMRHIVKYQAKEVVLKGGISLPASPRLYALQKQKYLLWKGRNAWKQDFLS